MSLKIKSSPAKAGGDGGKTKIKTKIIFFLLSFSSYSSTLQYYHRLFFVQEQVKVCIIIVCFFVKVKVLVLSLSTSSIFCFLDEIVCLPPLYVGYVETYCRQLVGNLFLPIFPRQ